MKKLLPALALLLLVVSCKKQTVQQDMTGVWQVYKYTQHGFDQTALFDSLQPGYTIAFTNNGKFVEADTSGSPLLANAGTYIIKNNNGTLGLLDSVSVQVDTLTITALRERDYTIFGLSKTTLQLVTDSSNTYLSKK